MEENLSDVPSTARSAVEKDGLPRAMQQNHLRRDYAYHAISVLEPSEEGKSRWSRQEVSTGILNVIVSLFAFSHVFSILSKGP